MKISIKLSKPLTVAILAAFVVVALSSVIQAGVQEISKGREVKLKFPAGVEVSSKTTSPGVPVRCLLAEPIEIGGVVVVEEGAEATASVLEATPAGKGGKPGYIKISFTRLDPKGQYQLINAEYIKLEGTEEAEGKGRKLLSYLFIFGLFIKGSEAVIPSNQVYTAKVAETVYLEDK